jgi:hypothetical protein
VAASFPGVVFRAGEVKALVAEDLEEVKEWLVVVTWAKTEVEEV